MTVTLIQKQMKTFVRAFSVSVQRPTGFPRYFSDPTRLPSAYTGLSDAASSDSNAKNASPESDSKDNDSLLQKHVSDRMPEDRIWRDLSLLVAMGALAYIAIDNFINRLKLERANSEITAINLKSLQAQQASFANARKNRDLQMLEERKENARRDFRMSLHIALLRKQLEEAGISAVGIDKVLKEYEQNVKIDNSFRNVSGQNLWLLDDSRKYFFSCSRGSYRDSKAVSTDLLLTT